jgi:hypothetical protein
MCLGSVANTLLGGIGGLLLGNQSQPSQPAVAAPIAPPQAAKSPDVNALQSAAQTPGGGINSGPASTMLTGANGVDQSKLNVGKGGLLGANTLLGS